MASRLLLDRTKGELMKVDIDFKRMRQWHENLTWEIMEFFGWDEYQMLWVAWVEGLVLGLLILWIL